MQGRETKGLGGASEEGEVCSSRPTDADVRGSRIPESGPLGTHCRGEFAS